MGSLNEVEDRQTLNIALGFLVSPLATGLVSYILAHAHNPSDKYSVLQGLSWFFRIVTILLAVPAVPVAFWLCMSWFKGSRQ